LSPLFPAPTVAAPVIRPRKATIGSGLGTKKQVIQGDAFDVPIVQPPLAEVIASGNVVAGVQTDCATSGQTDTTLAPDPPLGQKMTYSISYSNNLALGTIKERGYKFAYDPLNRLMTATHKEGILGTGIVWSNSNAFHEHNLSYDLNGNILSLSRKGTNGSLMDALSYNYGTGDVRSNKLMAVVDDADKTKGRSCSSSSSRWEDEMLRICKQCHGHFAREPSCPHCGVPAVDDLSHAGLVGLTLILQQRTAVEAGSPMAVDIEQDECYLPKP